MPLEFFRNSKGGQKPLYRLIKAIRLMSAIQFRTPEKISVSMGGVLLHEILLIRDFKQAAKSNFGKQRTKNYCEITKRWPW